MSLIPGVLNWPPLLISDHLLLLRGLCCSHCSSRRFALLRSAENIAVLEVSSGRWKPRGACKRWKMQWGAAKDRGVHPIPQCGEGKARNPGHSEEWWPPFHHSHHPFPTTSGITELRAHSSAISSSKKDLWSEQGSQEARLNYRRKHTGCAFKLEKKWIAQNTKKYQTWQSLSYFLSKIRRLDSQLV